MHGMRMTVMVPVVGTGGVMGFLGVVSSLPLLHAVINKATKPYNIFLFILQS